MPATTKRPAIGERTMALKAVPFFTQLSDRELDVVRAVATEKTYPKNAVVLTEGEMGDSLYMIQSGKVKVFIGDEEGREIILKILGPGDFFGEMAMMGDGRRVADVVATSPITLFEMFGTHFRELEMILPEVAARIRATLEERRAAL